jgi:hypothetical protein
MDVITAAFNVVHDCEGGSGAIAQLLGKARGTIDNEVNPPRGSYAKLGLLDAVKVTKKTGDHRILYAFAEECEHICLPAPRGPVDPDASTEKILTKASKLSGEIATEFQQLNQALADGDVSPRELERFERESLVVVAAIADVVRAMRSKMEGDLARHHAAVEDTRRGQA